VKENSNENKLLMMKMKISNEEIIIFEEKKWRKEISIEN